MVQFNLLPDVKLNYIKAKRTKQTVTIVAAIIGAVSLFILVILFITVNVAQKQHLNNLSDDIKKESKTLEDNEDLTKILTVQNQLGSLGELHKKKPVVSRLSTYLSQVTPPAVKMSEFTVNFTDSTISVTGSATDLGAVNTFVDTLKFTKFKTEAAEEKAFSEVVLASFGRGEEDTTYQITLKFNPAIFDGAQQVQLVVPTGVTTRSVLEKPEALFEESTQQEEGQP